MSNALFGMGIEDAFLPFRADFTPMTDDLGISLSNVSIQLVFYSQILVLDLSTKLFEMGLGWYGRWCC